jgi:hypothetical protein
MDAFVKVKTSKEKHRSSAVPYDVAAHLEFTCPLRFVGADGDPVIHIGVYARDVRGVFTSDAHIGDCSISVLGLTKGVPVTRKTVVVSQARSLHAHVAGVVVFTLHSDDIGFSQSPPKECDLKQEEADFAKFVEQLEQNQPSELHQADVLFSLNYRAERRRARGRDKAQ